MLLKVDGSKTMMLKTKLIKINERTSKGDARRDGELVETETSSLVT